MFDISSPSPTAPIYYIASGVGANYSLTTGFANIVFGTSNPSFTIDIPGRYLVNANVQINYSGATFAGVQNVNCKVVRTNNDAVDLTSSVGLSTNVVTTLTAQCGVINCPQVIYSTSNSNDILTIQGIVATAPSVGSLTVSSAVVSAIKID